MKKNAHLLIALCAVALSTAATSHAKEKLLNPGLEDGLNYWNATEASLETTLQRTGTAALRIDQSTTDKSAYQQVSCPPGAFVSADGWLRTSSCAQPATLTLRFIDGYGATLSDIAICSASGTTAYTRYEVEGIEAPANTVRARLILTVVGSTTTGGFACSDDLSLDVFAHGPVSRITNGGFESNFWGWENGHSVIDTTNVFAGSKASRLDHQSFFTQRYQIIPCVPEDSFSISFAHATAAATSGSAVALRYLDAAGNILSEGGFPSLTGTNAYATYYSDEIVPPANATKMLLRFVAGSGGTGSSYLDDVKVSSGDPGLASPLFLDQALVGLHPNPGFENAKTGWTNTSLTNTPAEVASGTNAAYRSAPNTYIHYDLSSASTMPAEGGKYYLFTADLKTTANDLTSGPDITAICVDSSGSALSEQFFTDSTLRGTRPYKTFKLGFFAPTGTTGIKFHLRYPGSTGSKFFWDNVQVSRVDTLPVRLVPTYACMSVYVARQNAPSGEVAHVYYRKQGETAWNEAFPPVYDSTRAEYRGSIVDLDENTTYEVQALLEADGVVSDEAGASAQTWSSAPPIATTYNVSDLYTSGEWVIDNLHGSPTGWIKIVGTGSDDVDGDYVTTSGDDYGRAILIKNCDYLILENIHVKGGRFHGIEIRNGDNIRISKCEIEGWARQPAIVASNGRSYESQADYDAGNYINNDAAVFINASNRVTVERSYMHDPRLGSLSQAEHPGTHPAGPNGVFLQNYGTRNGNHVIRYNDMIGGDQLRWNDAIEGKDNDQVYGSLGRDGDIYGNMLAMGSDDSLELDGGQVNVRVFENRIENFYTGISISPNMRGPGYVFRNLITNLGDQIDACWSMIKCGGGDTYTKGRDFIFNNTMVSPCNGIAGVGYKGTKDPPDTNYRMFWATSRNNLIWSTNTATTYNQPIWDIEADTSNSFDYDNLTSGPTGNVLSSAHVVYSSGQEANGILTTAPTFVSSADGDYRLAPGGSSAIDAGQPLANFAENYAGTAPDQGAYEVGASSLMPVRPIAITADKYLVLLTATANGGSSTSVDVTLTTGDLGGTTTYAVRKNANTAWLSVTPAHGTLTDNSTQTFTLTVNTTGLSAGQREAVVLVRLANGYSVPISVTANVN